MKIDPLSLTVRDLCDGYADHAEDGVAAYGGRLDIRPKCQREMKGGHTTLDNLQMLCRTCNLKKGNI